MSKETFKESILKAKELLFSDPEFKEKLADLGSITSVADFLKSFKLVWWILQKVALTVEQLYKEYHLVSEEQRVDLAAELLDDLIAFKGWMAPLELIDGVIWKVAISAAVQALNDKLGKNWLNKK